MPRVKRWVKILLGILLAAGLVVYTGNTVLRWFEPDTPSVATGTPANGTLQSGKRMPTAGENFVSYARLGALLGRTSVHHRVRDAVLAAYAEVATTQPDVTYILGETSWPRGGPFPPHRTHQNGLSVDFMVPVRTRRGEPALLPTWPWHTFGYGIDFDASGCNTDQCIDFDALAAHLTALAETAPQHGLAIDRVILAPNLQPELFATEAGAALRTRLRFSQRPSWVRHDDHYHVDFRLR